LLLDLRLPDAPGLDVLREIRASAGATGRYDPALPVIVLSGRGTEADRVRGFAEGADDYLVNPSQCSLSRRGGVPSGAGPRFSLSSKGAG
jgi:DNA-binding response OmpR family regulator